MTSRSELSPDAAAGGEIWGTWEELLLACAVSRHGTASWESVAMEVQTRSPYATRLTPHGCRLRFRHLHRRFAGGEEDPEAAAANGWVEELRRLRVAELRREVQRHDISIGSLQLKVKQLVEERERSISGETKPEIKEEESPEEAAGGDRVSGEGSGLSCRESNSTDLKRPKQLGDDNKTAKDELSTGEGAAKEDEISGESVAESKESADVQSSASLCFRRRRKAGRAGEEASVPLSSAQSEPLAALLETIEADKFGSVFESLLKSQESSDYQSTIRRHVDLEIIRRKLEGSAGSGTYYSSSTELYRDLLLLCTNAVVFFSRTSPEHSAAVDLRAVVSKHISVSLHEQKQSRPAVLDTVSAPPAKRTKTDSGIAGSLLEKTPPLIFCRKRSSIVKSAAAASKSRAEMAEDETKELESEEKMEEAAAKDKARGLRTNKNRGIVKNSSGSNATSNQRPVKVAESTAVTDATRKSDRKGSSGGAAAGGLTKKRNAVEFLNRMKQSSSSSSKRVSLLRTPKRPEQNKARKGNGGYGSKKTAKTAPSKRSMGRPPKRSAAPPTTRPAKRAKENTSGKPSSRKRGGKK